MGTDDSSQRFGTYLYCVGRAKPLVEGGVLHSPALGERGSVRIVEFNDLAAVVSDSYEPRYSVTRKHIMAHERVIEEALERTDVLPMRLGLVAQDDEELKEMLLARQYSALERELDRIHDRVELGVKVSWEEPRLFWEILEEYPDLRPGEGGVDATFDERLRAGELIGQAKDEKQYLEAEAILAELRPLAAEVVENQMVADMMLLNAAFLVDRGRVPEFDERVRQLGEREAGRLVFTYVGPLPPYNFVETSLSSGDELGAA